MENELRVAPEHELFLDVVDAALIDMSVYISQDKMMATSTDGSSWVCITCQQNRPWQFLNMMPVAHLIFVVFVVDARIFVCVAHPLQQGRFACIRSAND